MSTIIKHYGKDYKVELDGQYYHVCNKTDDTCTFDPLPSLDKRIKNMFDINS